MFRGTLLCFILCPLPLFLPLGTQVLSLFCSLHPHIHPSDSPPWDSQLKPGPSFLVTKQLQWQQISRNQPATQKLVPSLGQNVSLFPTPIPLLAFTILEEKDFLYGNSDLTDLIPSWFSSLPATTRCGRTVKKFLQVPEKRLLPKMKHFPATGNVFWEKKKVQCLIMDACLNGSSNIVTNLVQTPPPGASQQGRGSSFCSRLGGQASLRICSSDWTIYSLNLGCCFILFA